MNQPLDDLLRRLNPALRGWCAYFRPGVSSATFAYLSHYLWQRYGDGCDANTAGPPGRNSAAATAAAAGGPAGQDRETVRPGEGGHHPLPLPGIDHPVTLADHRR